MSTRRTRKGGKNKYIKIQDIDNAIYESDDEDSSNEILMERDRKQAAKGRGNRSNSGEAFNEPDNLQESSSSDILNKSSIDSKEKTPDLLINLPSEPIPSQQAKDSESGTETNKLELNKTTSSSQEAATEETEDLTGSGKKRNSLSQNSSTSSPKRVKTDSNKKMSDPPEHKPLQVELLMEKNRVPFKRRNINTIIEELDTISRKLKEGYEKCERPMYWGTPIVKQSSEKWDPNYIPEKLLDLYEKRFEMDQPCTSSSLSENTSESQADYKAAESKTIRTCAEGIDEEAFEASEYDNLDEHGVEDPYGASASGRMTLRSMSQNRQGYEERISSDAGKDNYGMDKHFNKCSAKSGKNKNLGASKKRVISELERAQDSQYLDDESMDAKASFEKLTIDDSVPSTSLGAVKSHLEEKAIALPPRIVEEEKVACPICGKNFEKNRIESHANHCATETFRD